MPTIGMRAMAGHIVRFSRDRKACLYYFACVVLLVVAAGLRFRDLSGTPLWYDEAVAANNSKGELRDVIPNTRHSNSCPILYPLVLYAVQEIESTPFSVRIVPAMASVLTVAVMLFLLPGPRGCSGSRVTGGPAHHALRRSNLALPGCARILH